MSKIFWLDCETGGVDSALNPLLQLAYIIEIDGIIQEKDTFFLRPFGDKRVEPTALDVIGKTYEEITQYPDPALTWKVFQKTLAQYIDRYDKKDKFIMAGYNIGFDEQFLRQFFTDMNDAYFGAWFHWPKIDVQTVVAQALASDFFSLPNYKLSSVCSFFNIPLKAHDAMEDITATRSLYHILSRAPDAGEKLKTWKNRKTAGHYAKGTRNRAEYQNATAPPTPHDSIGSAMKKQKSKTSDGAAKDPSLHAKANKIIKMPKRCKSKYDNSLWTPEDIADDFLESRKSGKDTASKAIIISLDSPNVGDYNVNYWLADMKFSEAVALLEYLKNKLILTMLNIDIFE